MASTLYDKVSKIQQIKNQKITASNLRQGVNAFGINGTYTSNSNAIAADLAIGKTAYVNGAQIVGTVNEYNADTREIPFGYIRDDKTNQVIKRIYDVNTNISTDSYLRKAYNSILRDGAYSNITYNSLSSLLNINPINIKKGSTILDVEGLYDASTEFSGIKMDPVVASDVPTSLTRSMREISGLDISNGVNLQMYFSNLPSLVSVSNLKAPNVTSIALLFYSSYNLQTVTSVNFYGEEQTGVDCHDLFALQRNITKLDNTVIFPKVINSALNMFSSCTNLTEISSELNINTDYIVNMFSDCSNLINIRNLKFNSTKAEYNCYCLFHNCCNLDIANINFTGINVNNSCLMFSNIKNITDENVYNILNKFNKFNVSSSCFSGTSLAHPINLSNISNIKLTNGTNVSSLYSRCSNMTDINCDISTFNVSPIGWFSQCSNLNKVNLYLHNNATSFREIFYDCSNLTQVNIVRNHSSDLYINNAFYNCQSLEEIDLSKANISTLRAMYYTFLNCTNLKRVNFGCGSVSTYAAGAFRNCANLTDINFGVDISNRSNCFYNSMSYIFDNCYSLKNIGFNRIDSSLVNASISNIFYNCSNLTGDMSLNFTNYNVGFGTNIFTRSGFNKISLNTQYSSTYSINYNVIASDCPNLKIADYSFKVISSTNYSYITRLASNCPNLTDTNVNVYTEGTSIYSTSLFDNCPNLINLSVNMISNKTTNCTFGIYNCPNLTNPAVNIDGFNRITLSYFLTPYINVNLSNCSNVNLSLTLQNMLEPIDITINNQVQNLSYLSISNYNKSTFKLSSNNLKTIGNFFFHEYAYNTTELLDIDFNVPNVTNFSGFNVTTSWYKAIRNINITTANNSIMPFFNLNILGHDDSDVNVNVPHVSNITYFNLVLPINNFINTKVNLQSMRNIHTMYISYSNNASNINFITNNLTIDILGVYSTNALTEPQFDSLLGWVSNINVSNTYYKNIRHVFVSSNKDLNYFSNLPNYNNLIAKGWTY